MSKPINFDTENALGTCPGVLAGQTGDSKQGLVVIQEWWGMNEQIQQEAREIADLGSFVTLVPDLYRGKVATDHETAGHFMSDLDWAGAVKDIQGAIRYLKSIGCAKVGVTGFCMGGALSLATAALVPEVDAAAPFYGIPSEKLADLSKINVPLQCHFGTLDDVKGFSDPDAQKSLREKLDAAGVKYEWLVYEAGHGFTNPINPNYQKDICDKALTSMVTFMQKHLAIHSQNKL